MSEPTVGAWLRSERERRGITLRTVADQTKVAAPLLEGLESGDLSRWPGGIYRRAFVKAYASALGLDPDEVIKRFELEHRPVDASADSSSLEEGSAPVDPSAPGSADRPQPVRYPAFPMPAKRARLMGTAADLTVALVLGMGSAAAGSRLLWPVLLIAGYYAIGVLLKGTSPMVALLSDETAVASRSEEPGEDPSRPVAPRPQPDRRHPARRAAARPQRQARTARTRHT